MAQAKKLPGYKAKKMRKTTPPAYNRKHARQVIKNLYGSNRISHGWHQSQIRKFGSLTAWQSMCRRCDPKGRHIKKET